MTPEGDSRVLASATSSSTDTTMAHGTDYFNFCGLPRELRDMIYDQFQRLHPDTPRFLRAGQPEPMVSHAVRTKPITPLLLVNKQIGSEYRDACEERWGVIVSNYMDQLVRGDELEEEIHSFDNKELPFIHMHTGEGGWGLDPEWTLEPLKHWLAHWNFQMPKLDSITVSICLDLSTVETVTERRKLEEVLEDFVSVPKLRELKVITMHNASNYNRMERGPNSKKLLVHWTPSGARKPTLIDSPQPYLETCCDRLDPWVSILDGLNSDSDDSSSHSDGGFDNDDDDGDDDEDGGEDGDSDFESIDENNDAGNSSHGNLDNGDEEIAENDDTNDDEDSDESGSGDADVTSGSENNQAPSYFDFFGLPPEIRDMIYDLPEMLDQEIPLYHFKGIYYSSLAMGATKPRTPLLLVNHQFSSEYKSRCEGRSGLVISDRLSCFIYGGWAAEVGMPPKAAEAASFMHIHIGAWMDHLDWLKPRLEVFETWLAYWLPRMPELETITVVLYTYRDNIEDPEDREDFIRPLAGLIAVEQLTEIKVVVMKVAEQWQSKDKEKHLFVDWKRASAAPIQLMYPPIVYEEKCCDGSFTNDTEVYDSLPHNWDE